MYEAPEKFPSDLPSDEELPRATCLEASQSSLEQLTQNARGPRPQPVWDYPLKQQVHSVAVGRDTYGKCRCTAGLQLYSGWYIRLPRR